MKIICHLLNSPFKTTLCKCDTQHCRMPGILLLGNQASDKQVRETVTGFG